ncbi:MAG: crosslink repair DNA glycosylase YcaQ family protein [Chloroflexota bacterium]
MSIYPLSALRSLALHATGLDVRNGKEAPVTIDTVMDTVNRLGAVQIDTLQMVARAHYLTLWSRMGTYDISLFDTLANDPQSRRIFEGWFHAACFLPLHEYRYQLPRQRFMREHGHHWYTDWIEQPGSRDLVSTIFERIRVEGGLRANSVEGEKLKHGTWWNWRPEKMALEHLYGFGDLMISGRVKFQRVYDLTERVLPDWVDQTEPSAEERDCFWLEQAVKALGICLPRNAADYTWMKLGIARPLISRLIHAGRLVEVQGETMLGNQTLLVHPQNLTLLEKAASGEVHANRTTFLNPFDNLWWAQGRDEAFWGFRQRLEAYYPAQKRVYGYFCLPILHKDRLIGRFDPKLERKTGLLRIKALYLEPGVEPDEELIKDVAGCMRDFMKFHKAQTLLIEKSACASFGEKLVQEI